MLLDLATVTSSHQVVSQDEAAIAQAQQFPKDAKTAGFPAGNALMSLRKVSCKAHEPGLSGGFATRHWSDSGRYCWQRRVSRLLKSLAVVRHLSGPLYAVVLWCCSGKLNQVWGAEV